MNKPALLCATLAALFAAPASALTFSFTYSGAGTDADNQPTPITAAGTLTTTDTTTQVNGRAAYTITGINGTRNGATIDQLFAAGTTLDQFGSVSDNYLFATGPYLTFNGPAFGVVGDDYIYNIYFGAEPGPYGEFISLPGPSAGPAGVANNNVTTFTITQLTVPASPAPEPATWAMMLLGFGVIGAAVRRRRAAAAVAA